MRKEVLTKQQWPILNDECYLAIQSVLQRGILSGTEAPEVQALEQELAEWLQSNHVVATGSGTASLILALLALELDPGSEVIVPAYTFGATAMAVLLCGLVPKFVDVDPTTYNLNFRRLSAACSSKTKAIIPVHMHGLPCDMKEICLFAKENRLAVVEDCAQAHGSEYRGKPVGKWGDIACFSMQSSKHLGVGEGGFLVTDDSELAERARSICSFGFNLLPQNHRFVESFRDGYSVFREHIRLGGMFRLQELPAALARVQLRSLTARIERVQYMIEQFIDRIGSLPGILIPSIPSDRTHVWHKVRIGVDVEMLAPNRPTHLVRDLLRAKLEEQGLETTLWQAPILPLQTAFQQYAGATDWKNSAAQKASEQSFILFNEVRPLIAQETSFVDIAAEAFLLGWKSFIEELKAVPNL